MTINLHHRKGSRSIQLPIYNYLYAQSPIFTGPKLIGQMMTSSIVLRCGLFTHYPTKSSTKHLDRKRVLTLHVFTGTINMGSEELSMQMMQA